MQRVPLRKLCIDLYIEHVPLREHRFALVEQVPLRKLRLDGTACNDGGLVVVSVIPQLTSLHIGIRTAQVGDMLQDPDSCAAPIVLSVRVDVGAEKKKKRKPPGLVGVTIRNWSEADPWQFSDWDSHRSIACTWALESNIKSSRPWH